MQSVTQLSLVLSSVGFSVRGAVGCHVGGQSLPPNPEGVTPTAARTALYLPFPVRSCRGPKRSLSILLDSLASRRPGVSVPSRASPEGPGTRRLSAPGAVSEKLMPLHSLSPEPGTL